MRMLRLVVIAFVGFAMAACVPSGGGGGGSAKDGGTNGGNQGSGVSEVIDRIFGGG